MIAFAACWAAALVLLVALAATRESKLVYTSGSGRTAPS